MAFSVGVDVSENRGLDVVVLDKQRRLARDPLAAAAPANLQELLASLAPDVAVVAIDSPPGPGSTGATRPCEVELRNRGIRAFSTPADPGRFAGAFYGWVRTGMEAFAAAREAGFVPLEPGETVKGRAIEVFPHATDVLLRGVLPPAGTTRSLSRKRRWRTETLSIAGVEGVDRLRTLDAVDAALAALTGVLGLEGRVEVLGAAPFLLVVPTGNGARLVREREPAAAQRRADAPLCIVGAYELDDDRGRVDRDALWRFLSQDAYWGTWRRREDIDQQLAGAWRVVAAYERATGRMVGFARALSDGVAAAYIADVYVEAEARGNGLGVALVEQMVERGPGADFRWMLHTRDAHGLYERFGFAPPGNGYLERPSRKGRP